MDFNPSLAETIGYVIKEISSEKLYKNIDEVLMNEEQKSQKELHCNEKYYLEKLKKKIRKFRIKISNLKGQYKSIDNDKKVEYWRAIEDLEEKIFWISEDTKSYEILGEKGWEDISSNTDR